MRLGGEERSESVIPFTQPSASGLGHSQVDHVNSSSLTGLQNGWDEHGEAFKITLLHGTAERFHIRAPLFTAKNQLRNSIYFCGARLGATPIVAPLRLARQHAGYQDVERPSRHPTLGAHSCGPSGCGSRVSGLLHGEISVASWGVCTARHERTQHCQKQSRGDEDRLGGYK